MMELRAILMKPLAVWTGMLVLAAISLGYALMPGAPAKLLASLLIVIVQASLVLTVFMNLGRASALVRITALIGVVWLGFLFILAFADLLTR